MSGKCNACLWREECVTESDEAGTLWTFPYPQYPEFDAMLIALRQHYADFLQQHPQQHDAYWNRHNTDGYTFTQWTIYYVSKKTHSYRRIRPIIEKLFQALSRMPFFGRLLALGRADDRHHHTLHHYLFWMESGMTFFQKRLYRHLVHWLNRHRMSYLMFVCDQHGRNVNDYFHQVQLPDEIFAQCRALTRAYKGAEQRWFAQLDFLSRCRECHDCVQPYDDLIERAGQVHEWLDKHPEWTDAVWKMIRQREQCNRMYADSHDDFSRLTNEQSVLRHDYVLDVYRTVFDCEENQT